MAPRLLDLYCGAGGCSVGYERAGFEVVGVDINPQRHYRGGAFVQADVIENVPGAPLKSPLLLCGTMFGLRVYRHRLFEVSRKIVTLHGLHHAAHSHGTGSHRGYSRGPFITVGGHNFNRQDGAAAMGIDWMATRGELSEAIPPAYTHWIGLRLLAELG